MNIRLLGFKRVYFLGFILFVSCGLRCGYALYNGNPHVVELTPFNFKDLVVKSDAVWLVEYYVPWCGYCQRLAPDFKLAAEALKGIIKVGAVNGEKHKMFIAEANIKSYPTLKIFTNTTNFIYKGRRVVEGLVEACLTASRYEVYKRLGKNPDDYSSIKIKALREFDALVKNYLPQSKVLNENNDCKIK
ncbi:hypothetical protein B5X24_HaOG204371 [Helicoverpa armigera]|uniref:Thioredoxin domain-containing protein n=1 Tax=Helicoverpa armigera TaxID=29058 RepID=A0A2W1BXW2_HELAM|nr:protein disulfide-isomerase A6 [Helicoverpa armigera]PZC76603.1 hypothetical protein B5X24_HaOG204371 [Helicoverpa armigera]